MATTAVLTEARRCHDRRALLCVSTTWPSNTCNREQTGKLRWDLSVVDVVPPRARPRLGYPLSESRRAAKLRPLRVGNPRLLHGVLRINKY